MPTYDYVCDACGHTFEKFQTMSSALVKVCPKCGKKKVRRLIGTGAGLIFKGSGFYITDYREKGYAESKKADSGESKPADSGDAKPSESKSDTPKSEPAKSDAPAKADAKPETPVAKSEPAKASKKESKSKKSE